MFNSTDKLIVLTRNRTALKCATTESLLFTAKSLAKLNGTYSGLPGQMRLSNLGFSRFYPIKSIPSMKFGDIQSFLLSVYSIVNGAHKTSTATMLVTSNGEAPPLRQLGNVRMGLALTLIRLWSKGHILFPMNFHPYLDPSHNNKYSDVAASLNTEVAAYFRSLSLGLIPREKHFPDLLAHERKFLRIDGQRLFWALDWHTFDQVNLKDLADAKLMNAAIRHQVYEYALPLAVGTPITVILQELKGPLAKKANLTRSDFDMYVERVEQGLHRIRNTVLAQGARTTDGTVKSDTVTSVTNTNPHNLTDEDVIAHIANTRLATGSGMSGWPGVQSYFPGFEFLKVTDAARYWASLLDEYLVHWSKRYESGGKRKSLKPLAEYLFVYLPWWFSCHKSKVLSYPANPKDFVRFDFVKSPSMGLGGSVEKAARPLRFMEYVEKRIETKTPRGSVQKAAYDFFEYLAEEYSHRKEKDLRARFGKVFVNPIKVIDVYHEGRTKVGKAERIPHALYLYLRKYLYALESYLTVLQDAFNSNEFTDQRSLPIIFDVSRYPICTPIVIHAGRVIPITKIPRSFLLFESPIECRNQDNKVGVMSGVVSIGVTRLIVATCDIGLRTIAMRYLDRYEFDKHVGENPNLFTKKLYVNTDKAKDKPYTTWIMPAVMKMLIREKQFDQSIVDSRFSHPVHYQKRLNSRFNDVYPLFLSTDKNEYGGPLSYASVANYWMLILFAFQAWFKEATGEGVQLVTPTSEAGTEDGPKTLPDLVSNWRTDYTPHSLRATLISERSSVMPFDLNAELVGQGSAEVAEYYYQPDFEDISRKLELSNELLEKGWSTRALNALTTNLLESRGANVVRPSDTDSALRRAMEHDRVSAAVRHGFTTIALLNPEEDEAAPPQQGEERLKDGLNVIMDASIDQIAFRDTHMCPTNLICPKEVMPIIREPRRCGLCPLGVKSLDNLPAIQAKKHFLEGRARKAKEAAARLRKKSASEVDIQENLDMADMDILESIGWHLSERILLDKLQDMRERKEVRDNVYHVDDPTMLTRHVERVALPDSDVARLLQRVGEANAYPAYQDDSIQELARRLKRVIFGQQEGIFAGEIDPVTSLCAAIKNMLDLNEISITDLVSALEAHHGKVQRAIENAEKDALEIPIRKLIRRN